jgi:hypothetical protein
MTPIIAALRADLDHLCGPPTARAQTDVQFGQVCKEIDALGDAGGAAWAVGVPIEGEEAIAHAS